MRLRCEVCWVEQTDGGAKVMGIAPLPIYTAKTTGAGRVWLVQCRVQSALAITDLAIPDPLLYRMYAPARVASRQIPLAIPDAHQLAYRMRFARFLLSVIPISHTNDIWYTGFQCEK